jgi:hypothetical protein
MMSRLFHSLNCISQWFSRKEIGKTRSSSISKSEPPLASTSRSFSAPNVRSRFRFAARQTYNTAAQMLFTRDGKWFNVMN